MGPWKNEGSYWGYKEQGNGQLQSIQSFQRTTNNTRALDGHYLHTRNLEVITLARENHVDIICLPPHSTHKMQPLDKSFMGPLKIFYCQEIEKWLCSHPGWVITIYQIGKLFGNAYKRAATGERVSNGLRVTGLFPCDKNIFRPYDFPLSSEDKDATPVNHPALAKISHHSVLLNFAVHLCWGSPIIRYQPCAKPEPKAKSSWWNSKENNEFTLQNICWDNSEKENKTGH